MNAVFLNSIARNLEVSNLYRSFWETPAALCLPTTIFSKRLIESTNRGTLLSHLTIYC